MANMSLDEFVGLCESLESNKDKYLAYIEHYKSRMNESIKNHNLEDLDNIMDEYYDLNEKHSNNLLTADFIKINQIIKALYNERRFGFMLFWDDVDGFDSLIEKYCKIALMLRRLVFDIQIQFKNNALDYLATVSPFIIKTAYEDSTNLLGMEGNVYITLAKNSLKLSDQV
ncbi:hypothetical protein [Oribacterium sp. FC2011]|uniref:hypothetical protein n=1 Tax=Oribacterium sp. FC2011 TaxID=1408311 RepID=UPI0004E0C64E|nr:hypothetical protein [Oribacterium sp. FC2011]